MCLAQSASTENPPEPVQMLDQDRAFIEKAVCEAARMSDPVRQMYELIGKLKLIENPSNDDLEVVAKIVDDLEDLVCDIDCAADFCKLGGLLEVIRLLKTDCDPVCSEIARLIPSLAQSNPFVQDVILTTDLLPYLLGSVKNCNLSEELRMKMLGGISSIVRAHEKAFSHFCELKGLATIEQTFQKAVEMNHLLLANKGLLVTTSIARSLGPEAENYNVLSILLRMSLQLPLESTGCSYAFEYLMDNIVGELDNCDSRNDGGCKKKYMELDNHCKKQFSELLRRQLKRRHESEEDSKSISEKLKMISKEDIYKKKTNDDFTVPFP